MTHKIRIITEPVVIPLAHMQLMSEGLEKLTYWLRDYRPACLEGIDPASPYYGLFPHDGEEEPHEPVGMRDPQNQKSWGPRPVTHNELLVELAGRNCYHSYGAKAGRKTNREYIENTQGGDIPHASIMYHAKMSFFIGNVSRRVSHELIRHYVGADRDEEGSPSQESTRYTEHPGFYVPNVRILEDEDELEKYEAAMWAGYTEYREYISRSCAKYEKEHGAAPKGLDRKRIYEAASSYRHHSVTTSFVWTTNPVALAKLLRERDNEAADLEFARLAKMWKKVAVQYWPNLFPHLLAVDNAASSR